MYTFAVHYTNGNEMDEKVAYINADTDEQAETLFDNQYSYDKILLITKLY